MSPIVISIICINYNNVDNNKINYKPISEKSVDYYPGSIFSKINNRVKIIEDLSNLGHSKTKLEKLMHHYKKDKPFFQRIKITHALTKEKQCKICKVV